MTGKRWGHGDPTSHLTMTFSVSSDHWYVFNLDLSYCSIKKKKYIQIRLSLKVQFITIKTCLEFKFLFQIYRFGDGCPLFHCNCYLPWEQGQLERQVALNGVRLQQRVDEGVMGIFNL